MLTSVRGGGRGGGGGGGGDRPSYTRRQETETLRCGTTILRVLRVQHVVWLQFGSLVYVPPWWTHQILEAS